MTSPNYPSQYNSSQSCIIDIRSNGTITALDFSTEAPYDNLRIGEFEFSGTVGPAEVPVSANTTVHWHSGFANHSRGWRLCWSGSSEPIMAQSLEVLSLARNYLTGNTDHLGQQSALKTLLLSSNYLSCQSAELEDATNLGQGHFADPTNSTLELAGKVLQGVTGGELHGSTPIKAFENTVLVFAGNTEAPHPPPQYEHSD